MKHKASELKGADLDRAVALAEGRRVVPHPNREPREWTAYRIPAAAGWDTICDHPDEIDQTHWSPSTKWEHGGPIIERERIALGDSYMGSEWEATVGDVTEYGTTALIAAMRAYVASKFGPEVELP